MKNLFLALMLLASTAFGADGLTWEFATFGSDPHGNVSVGSMQLQDNCTTGCANYYHVTGEANSQMMTVKFANGDFGKPGQCSMESTFPQLDQVHRGSLIIRLYDSSDSLTKTITETFQGRLGVSVLLGMAAADNLTYIDSPSNHSYGMLLSLANYATGRLEISVSGQLAGSDSGLCVCTANGTDDFCTTQDTANSGGYVPTGGNGHLVYTLPFVLGTIP